MNDTGPCDFNCPRAGDVVSPVAICCRSCRISRKYFVTPENKHLWTDDRGFLGDNGCKLNRDEMPQECRDYDCKNVLWCTLYIKYSPLKWKDGKWQSLQAMEGCFVTEADSIDGLLQVVKQQLEAHNERNT